MGKSRGKKEAPELSPLHKLQNAIIDSYDFMKRQKQSEAEFQKEKEKLLKEVTQFMAMQDLTQHEFKVSRKSSYTEDGDNDVEDWVYTCKKVEPQTINYIPEKLRENFDKDFCDEIIQKKYEVNDMEGLKELLKKHGVNPKEFKKFINVKETVDKGRLEQLYNLGEITLGRLKGCYTVVKHKFRWSINAKPDKRNDDW